MTSLKITPNFEKKTAKFEGTIAGGERVRVEIIDANEYIGGLYSLRLRAVGSQGETLAQFPFEDSEDKWAREDGKIICELNLNTDKMLEAVPPASRAMVLFVLDDGKNEVLYFKSFASVEHWPRKVGEEEPLNLAGYADFVSDVKRAIENAEASIDESAAQAMSASASAKTSAQSAVDAKKAAEEAQRRAELSHAASVAAASHAASIKNEAVNTFKNVEEEVLELKGTATTAIKIAEQVNVKTVLLEKKVDEAKTLANQSIEEINEVRAIAENAEGAVSETIETANEAKEKADAAYSPGNPPPMPDLSGYAKKSDIPDAPDLSDYAKKSGVVKLYMAEDEQYAENDLGDLGTTSPRELLAFTATVDVEDEGGNLIRSEDNIYGTVGADGFMMERRWLPDEMNPNEYNTYRSILGSESLLITHNYLQDGWLHVEESFSVNTEDATNEKLGIVLRYEGVEDGTNYASAMTPDFLYVDYIYGCLNGDSERGYNGVNGIEFEQSADLCYYDEWGNYCGVQIGYIVQVATDYSSGCLYNLYGLEFSAFGSNEIRFYENDCETGTYNDRVIYLSDIYNKIYGSSDGSICFGDNYYSSDDTGMSAAFGLIDSNNNSTYAYFGSYGMEVSNEYGGYTSVYGHSISTPYLDAGSVYSAGNIQVGGWLDAAEGITIGEAVLDQTSLQKLLALIAE